MVLPIRLPDSPGEGASFIDWLHEFEPRRQLRDRLIIFLQQWDHQRDELGREPSIAEYGREWNVPEAIAYRQSREFRRVFGAEPGELSDLLWDGIKQQAPAGRLMPFLGVRVVPR